jgi:hypothetical protein
LRGSGAGATKRRRGNTRKDEDGAERRAVSAVRLGGHHNGF